MDYRNAPSIDVYNANIQKIIKQKSKLDPETGCWNWQGAKGPRKYGSMRYKGKTNTPHKVSRIVFNGPVPPGMIVRHLCNNQRCVNPEHLGIGTQKENVRDTIEAGRFNKPKGSKHPNAKLTEDDVREIRELFKEAHLSKSEFCEYQACFYNISPGTISDIINRKTWKHVH